MLTSANGNGDGMPMVRGGSFAGFNHTVNVQPVPLPSAAILFGSSLIGLLGMARKRKPN